MRHVTFQVIYYAFRKELETWLQEKLPKKLSVHVFMVISFYITTFISYICPSSCWAQWEHTCNHEIDERSVIATPAPHWGKRGGMGRLIFLFSSLTCLRTPKKLPKGREGYAPFDSIDDKHLHPSNVVCECKVLYTHTVKVRVWKNARSPNNENQKRLL